jgi:phosphoglycerol geranylgeranyltransferase
MRNIYQEILNAKAEGKKLLAILLDPDKVSVEQIPVLAQKINQSPATHIFVGGSSFDGNHLDKLIMELKSKVKLPILLFPGNPSQISAEADAILFLSLLSGRNSDYLIEHQVNAVPILNKTNLEVISTGYILIKSGAKTAVERVTKTKPIDRKKSDYVLQTAQAGGFMGNKLIYLEAGSGAILPIPTEMIHKVSENIDIPLIVGGGIRSKRAIYAAYVSGADMVVIGTAFENDSNFFS